MVQRVGTREIGVRRHPLHRVDHTAQTGRRGWNRRVRLTAGVPRVRGVPRPFGHTGTKRVPGNR